MEKKKKRVRCSRSFGIGVHFYRNRHGHTGIYHKMSKKHLQRYIDEYAGRHNIRPLATMEQIEITFKGMNGKRLKYKELIQ